MTPPLLRLLKPADVPAQRRSPVEAEALAAAAPIVADVRERGLEAVREHALRLGDLGPNDPVILEKAGLEGSLRAIDPEDRRLLGRTAERISAFARAQRSCISDLTTDIPGGQAGHTLAPVERAGCYAPGGRYPLPSSVLMTACTARAAGVGEVWVAMPKPSPVMLAAAAIAGADGVLAVGGAQAIAALAYGADPVPACDAVVGPGNRYVTAAKQLVAGVVTIDMLAGPSEVLVIADGSAEPATIAADLLAQAEHDPDAIAILVSTSAALIERVNAELGEQLATLPTRAIAERALRNGAGVLAADLDEAIELANRLAPEHLQVLLPTAEARQIAPRLQHYGGLFLGERTAEVLGDYGAGPNHVLPTGGTARSVGGLSVLTFLRVRTWLAMDDNREARLIASDAARLARLEGLEAHARAAERRA